MTYLDNDTYQNLRALLIPATSSLIAQAELENEATEKLGALDIWPDICRQHPHTQNTILKISESD